MIINYLTESTNASSRFTQKEKEYIRDCLSLDVPHIISQEAVNKDPYIKQLKTRLEYWLNSYSKKHINFDSCEVWAKYRYEDSMFIYPHDLICSNFDSFGINFITGLAEYERNKNVFDSLEKHFCDYAQEKYGDYSIDTDLLSLYCDHNFSTFGFCIFLDYNAQKDVPCEIARIPWTDINPELAHRDSIDITRKEIGPVLTEGFLKSGTTKNLYERASAILDDFFLYTLDE